MNKDDYRQSVLREFADLLLHTPYERLRMRLERAKADNGRQFAAGAASRNGEVRGLRARIDFLEAVLKKQSAQILSMTGAVADPHHKPQPEWSAQGSTGDQPARTNADTK